MSYHKPVMLDECIEGLNIRRDGLYVDVTFGGGGHSRAILKKLDKGRLIAFDQDHDAEEQAVQLADPRLTFFSANFRYLKKYLRLAGIKEADGILADLGVSSHQFDIPERGFSTRFEADLDMRMDRDHDLTATQVLNEYSEKDLVRLFSAYGEIRNARTLTAAIVRERTRTRIQTADSLKSILEPLAPRGKFNKYAAQVFQALRIEVNDELKALEELLIQAAEVLGKGGRLVIISYHSLEDRMVKNFIGKGKFSGEVDKDFYGNEIKPFNAVSRKAIQPSEDEISVNSRARSARLRVAEKT